MKRCHNKHPDLLEMDWFTAASELPQDWDLHLPQHHFLLSDSLKAHDEAGFPNVQPLFVRIKSGNKTLALATFQLLTVRPEHLNRESLKPWQYHLWRAFTGTVKPKLLVAGQLYRHDVQSFYRTAEISDFEAFNLYRAAIDRAAKRCNTQAILVKDAAPQLAPYFQHYAPQYLLLRNDISMEMQIPAAWSTFADYEKSLKHKYAQRLRNVRGAWSKLRVQELCQEDVARYATDIFNLYLQVTQKQAVRMGYLTAAFLPALKKEHGERLKIWGIIYEGEKLVAFASAWVEADRFDMFYIGFDYSRNQELQLYFNILFFSVEQAVHYRKPLLILGRTALEAKARVGCKPHYLYTFLYVKNSLLRNIMERLQKAVAVGEGEWENRHPFKG